MDIEKMNPLTDEEIQWVRERKKKWENKKAEKKYLKSVTRWRKQGGKSILSLPPPCFE